VKVKVCGLTDNENIKEVLSLNVDMIGLNFYPSSPRYLSGPLSIHAPNKPKAGVFVNENYDNIMATAEKYGLDVIQLHGDENPEFCKKIASSIPVIKVFRIKHYGQVPETRPFNACQYFLFDTDTKSYGGSGQKFDWSIFENIELDRPFFLSGGIGPNDAPVIARINHPMLYGIDINSRFEVRPGIKDVTSIGTFLAELNKSGGG